MDHTGTWGRFFSNILVKILNIISQFPLFAIFQAYTVLVLSE